MSNYVPTENHGCGYLSMASRKIYCMTRLVEKSMEEALISMWSKTDGEENGRRDHFHRVDCVASLMDNTKLNEVPIFITGNVQQACWLREWNKASFHHRKYAASLAGRKMEQGAIFTMGNMWQTWWLGKWNKAPFSPWEICGKRDG